jgi:phosphohistidine phosphatase
VDLYLVQHGEALSEQEDPRRPLSDAGRDAARKVAEHLAARRPALIETPITAVRHSGKLRAQQTAEILAGVLSPEVAPTAGQGMNPKDDPRIAFEELTAGRGGPGGVVLVGHLPHLARLAGLLLAGDAAGTPVRFVNAGVLKISATPDAWAIEWCLTPACVG